MRKKQNSLQAGVKFISLPSAAKWLWFGRAIGVIVCWLGLGTVAQAQVAMPIYRIQGEGVSSPAVGQRVDAVGIVTAVAPRGFYFQDANGDGRPETSDGIFVYTSKAPQVQRGGCVSVVGARVEEYYGKTELTRPEAIFSANSCPLDAPQPVSWPLPQWGQNAEEKYERFEGMLVTTLPLTGTVQGPTKRFENGDVEIALLPAQLTPYLDDGRVNQTEEQAAAGLVYLSGGLGAELPDANWGDGLVVAVGGDPATQLAIADYNYGKYQLLLLPGAVVTHTPDRRPIDLVAPAAADEFTLCTFNLYGLGQGSAQLTEVAQYRRELDRRAQIVAGALQGCTILGLQETGTPADAQALAERLQTGYGLDYAATALGGPQTASPEFPLTNSVLTRRERVAVVGAAAPQGCSAVDYGVKEQPGVCPPNQYPLFDRTPLVVDMTVSGVWGEPYRLRLITNHWKSKAGDEAVNASRREQQALFVAGLAQEVLATDPTAKVAVMGDLNDYYDSAPVAALRMGVEPELVHAYTIGAAADRYTYIYNGASQVLDHILLSPAAAADIAEVNLVHVNADFSAPKAPVAVDAHHASDHDPALVRIRPGRAAWLGGNLGHPAIRVELVAGDGAVAAATVTDSLGDFRLWRLTPGKYQLTVTAPAYLQPTDTTNMVTVTLGSNQFVSGAPQHAAALLGQTVAMATALPEPSLGR